MARPRAEENTEARKRLIAWLAQSEDRSQSKLAEQLGLGQSSVSLWVHGRSRPEPHIRKALELLTGIGADLWDTNAERGVIEHARTIADDTRGAVIVATETEPAPARDSAAPGSH